ESQNEFFAALEEQGMDKDEVTSQIETEEKVDKLIASETGDVDPTKEELQEINDEYTAQIEQMGGEEEEKVDIASIEEMESDLIAQVKAEKESETYQTLIEELQADADITNHL